MYHVTRLILVFHMKFVGIVQNLWILSVSKLIFRDLGEKCKNKVFFILFVLVVYYDNQTTTLCNIHPLSVDGFKKS